MDMFPAQHPQASPVKQVLVATCIILLIGVVAYLLYFTTTRSEAAAVNAMSNVLTSLSFESETTDLTDGNIARFANLDVSCGANGVLSALQFKSSNDGKDAGYTYDCKYNDDYSITNQQYTPWDEASGNVRYLDRHEVACEGGLINELKLQMSEDGNYMRYAYKCAQPTKALLDPQAATTDPSAHESNLCNLEHHTLACPASQGLSRLALKTDKQNMWYSYECCGFA